MRINPTFQDRLDAIAAPAETTTTCPRCGTRHHGNLDAVSRTDNTTRICGYCGTNEAMQAYRHGTVAPQAAWLHPAP